MFRIESTPVPHRAPQSKPAQTQTQTHATPPQPQLSPEQAAAQLGVHTIGELELMADDLSSVLAQMRRRSEAERRSNRSTHPFASILEGEPEGKVDSLTVIARSSDVSKQGFLDLARTLFPDDSDLVLVLRELIRRRKIRKTGSVDVINLEEILEQVWNEADPKQCKAGLNVALKATLFSRTMEVSAQALRQSYRDFIVSEDGVLPQYELWVSQFGADRRSQIVDYMECAMLVDIQSHDPSCSKLEFGSLLGQVLTLKKLHASDLAFLQVFMKTSQNYALLEPVVLQTWLDCLQRPFQIKKEIDKHHLCNMAQTLMLPVDQLRQKLLTAISKIDGDLFMDRDIRHVLMDALLAFDPGRPVLKSPE